jgi:GT2 family glycosyltransferase/glycosyltransferase involved in cell wall biosynthesis
MKAALSLAELLAHDGDRFVECVYLTLLGRRHDDTGFAHYRAQLDRTGDKLAILLQVYDSVEARRRPCDVADLHEAMFRKRTAGGGLAAGVARIFSSKGSGRRRPAFASAEAAVAPLASAAAASPAEHQDERDLAELRELELLQNSALFDDEWYRLNQAVIPGNRKACVEHYYRFGAAQLLDPGPLFSTRMYLELNADVRSSGLNPLVHYLLYGRLEGRHANDIAPPPMSEAARYEAWLVANNWNSRAEADLQRRIAAAAAPLVPISVIMPVYRPDIRHLQRAIQSLRTQIHGDWQLCIADDASGDPELAAYLQGLASDPRIAVVTRSANGHISAATNSAAALATHPFLLFLDQDDELAVDALAEVALYVAAHPDADLVYSDSDKITEEGRRYDPHFKPDWSPELLLTYMYAGQVLTVRRSLFEQVGGMRLGFEGSQDHDLALRIGELSRHVGHIPRVLYHWRCTPGSTASSGAAKPYSLDAGRLAVQDALRRRGSAATAVRPAWALQNGNSFFQLQSPDTGPSVGIVIPTKNGLDYLRRCIDSLRLTAYRNYEVLVIDNESDEPAALDYLRGLPHRVVRVENRPGEGFNFARLQNVAAGLLETEYLLLLNNDTEVIDRQWLGNMVGIAQLPGVGACGARLLYDDGSIQHAGIVHGLQFTPVNQGASCGHAFKGLRGSFGYLSGVEATRNCVAVTAACLLTPRKLFLEVGGLDEVNFGVAYNDPDYCFRLADAGYRTVYVPNAILKHHEGKTRARGDKPQEIAAYLQKYWQRPDPYLNPNLGRDSETPYVAPRRVVTDRSGTVRVLLFTHNLNFEGAPIQLYDIAASLVRAGGFIVTVASPHDGKLRGRFEAIGIEVIVTRTPLHSGASMPAYERDMGPFCATIEATGAQLVLANTAETFYAVDAAARLRIPTLWLIHESEGVGYYHHWDTAIARHALRCFEYPYRVVFVSEATRRLFNRLPASSRFEVIPNALTPESRPVRDAGLRSSLRRELGIGAADVVYLNLGTVCERKGQLDVIRAVERLDLDACGGRTPRFLIVGDRPGDYSTRIHAAIEALTPAKQRLITMIPETRDAGRYYNAADVFLFCSRLESYPRVILEAISIGLPLLTTPVQGVSEQIQVGGNAETFAPGDIARISALVTEFTADESRRARHGAASPEAFRLLTSPEQMAAGYIRLIHEARLAGQSLPISFG